MTQYCFYPPQKNNIMMETFSKMFLKTTYIFRMLIFSSKSFPHSLIHLKIRNNVSWGTLVTMVLSSN